MIVHAAKRKGSNAAAAAGTVVTKRVRVLRGAKEGDARLKLHWVGHEDVQVDVGSEVDLPVWEVKELVRLGLVQMV